MLTSVIKGVKYSIRKKEEHIMKKLLALALLFAPVTAHASHAVFNDSQYNSNIVYISSESDGVSSEDHRGFD